MYSAVKNHIIEVEYIVKKVRATLASLDLYKYVHYPNLKIFACKNINEYLHT